MSIKISELPTASLRQLTNNDSIPISSLFSTYPVTLRTGFVDFGTFVRNIEIPITASKVKSGINSNATGNCSHAEGINTESSGQGSHSEGDGTQSIGIGSHSEGNSSISNGNYSHAEGNSTYAVGIGSHSEGYGTNAQGQYSHAEGHFTTTNGNYCHVEGYNCDASNNYSHAEGVGTLAQSRGSHTEGHTTKTTGIYAHAEGYNTLASGSYSHAEGYKCQSAGIASNAKGLETTASANYQSVMGRYNITSSNVDDLFIIGNGSSNSNRSNVFSVNATCSIINNLHRFGAHTGSSLQNLFFGQNALVNDTEGNNYSIAIGPQTLQGFTGGTGNGDGNIAIGIFALSSSTKADHNTVVGVHSLKNSLVNPKFNVVVGDNSLTTTQSVIGNSTLGTGNNVHGDYNIIIGFRNGNINGYPDWNGEEVFTGSNNILIGNYLLTSTGSANNQLNIANLIFSSGSSFGQYRQISTGSNVGIATATPTERLTVFGNISSSGLLFPVSSSLVNYPELIKTGSSYVDVVNNMLYVFTGNGGVGGWRYTALS